MIVTSVKGNAKVSLSPAMMNAKQVLSLIARVNVWSTLAILISVMDSAKIYFSPAIAHANQAMNLTAMESVTFNLSLHINVGICVSHLTFPAMEAVLQD